MYWHPWIHLARIYEDSLDEEDDWKGGEGSPEHMPSTDDFFYRMDGSVFQSLV